MSQPEAEAPRVDAPAVPDLSTLIAQGRQRGFVTFDEIQGVVPNPDEAVEVIERLTEVGITVRDTMDEAAPEEEDEVIVNTATLLDEAMSDALLGDSVRLYLREIGQVPLLNADQERRLATQIAEGQTAIRELAKLGPGDQQTGQATNLRRRIAVGDEARQQMAAANLRLVVSIAKRYRDRGLQLLDLIQEGSLGLLRAIEKFDHNKGFKFSTYATWWIKQALSRALADQSRLVRLPVHLGETLNRIQAARRQLTQVLGRDPTDGELATNLG
ncbi:MAG: sigma-70 family RNA polymerase sigma factor, partial [Chloroflexales bacterium]|nr:sigma-70 family RNA polymerase sigma factor [Chloroflexales bacterium]